MLGYFTPTFLKHPSHLPPYEDGTFRRRGITQKEA